MTPGKSRTGSCVFLLISALSFAAASPSAAQERSGPPVLRYGHTSSFWFFDGRDDNRDFRNNGVFPGNFAGDPPSASIGIEGFLAGNSRRSPEPYPSQVVMTPPQAPPCLHHRKRACR
jgi:hypothetical protein